MKNNLFYLLLLFVFLSCQSKEGISIKKGMTISKSVTITPKTYKINGSNTKDQPILTIEGNNITVDFNGAVLQGSDDKNTPDEFYGLGILIKNSQNVTIKNLTLKGFKWGIIGIDTDSLKIENSDVSYNYRPKLNQDNRPDQAIFYQNENDEWLKDGTAIYLKNCHDALIKGSSITEGRNGLLLVRCNNGLFYNNKISFNSGCGIGMYRSNNNRVMHNQLNWNIQNKDIQLQNATSASIVIAQHSTQNTFAYNSATHSENGILFLEAASDEARNCDDNLIFGNDFSYSILSGIEVHFNKNRIYNNSMVDCKTGILGRQTAQTEVMGNIIQDGEQGIFFENGQDNIFRHNDISNTNIGVRLSKNNEGLNQNYAIDHNLFHQVRTPFNIDNSDNIRIVFNQLNEFETLITTNNSQIIQKANQINPVEITPLSATAATAAYAPEPLPDGMNAMLPASQLKGKEYILVNEWGAYSFTYPMLWLREVTDNQYIFAMFAPYGNWKLLNAEGIDRISKKTGTFPNTLVVDKSADASKIKIEMEFIGEAVTTQFGKKFEKGAGVTFGYEE